MATAKFSNDRVYLFRLQILLIDGGCLVIKNIFNQKLQSQNSTLTVCLGQEKQTINHLKTQKTITQTQYDLLFPPGGKFPSTADFDITLTICLLRNLKICGLNPKYNWKSTPQSTDLSVEADITRLRTYRNEIAHISKTTGIQQGDFSTKWTEIEQILLRLNSSVLHPVPNLQQQIDDFKTCSLDQEEEQKLQKEFKVWRDMETGIEQNIQFVVKDVKSVAEDVHIIKKDVMAVSEDVPAIKKDVIAVAEDVPAIKKDVIAVAEDVPAIKKDVIAVAKDVSVIKKDVIAVAEDVPVIKKDVKAVAEDVPVIKKNVKAVAEDVPVIKKDVIAMAEDVPVIKKDVIAMAEDVPVIKKDVKSVAEDVPIIKKDVIAMAEDVPAIKKDVIVVAEDVSDIKKDVKSVKEDIIKIVGKLDNPTANQEKGNYQQTHEGQQTREVQTDIPAEDDVDLKLNTRRQTREVQTDILAEDDADIKLKTQLKTDLIDFYRSNLNTIPLSPLIEDEHTLLTEFYVSPNINRVHVERAFGGGREVRANVESLKDVLCNKGEKCNEIYLTADAGLGKTSFCKRLALAWCQAHTPVEDYSKCFSKDEIDALKNFDFLFLLFLRDSKDECDIDEIIKNQIVEELKQPGISKEEIGGILFSENKCMVVLDGLDEWTHPSNCKRVKSDVPHRKEREWTFLTTSRPWKLSVIHIPSTKIDQRIELAGLGRESANTLKMNVISHLSHEKDKTILETRLAAFNEAIEEKEISDLQVIPLLLMYLLCLWCEEIDLGNSQCELYSKIMELLLLRTDKKCKDIPTLAMHTQGDIPQCFSEQTYCTQLYGLLTSLAQLAFQTLFSETKESTLVFNNSIAEKCLNKHDEKSLDFCLQSGILTRSKVRGKLIKQEVKISFAHKTIHEFFAALYMHSTQDKSTVKKKVLSQCNSIKDILEMSKVFIFLSGINVNVLSSISRELINVINKDEITRQYRMVTGVTDDEKYITPLIESQNMYISCVKENPQNADLKLCLQDIFIDEDCRQETYYKQLQQLAVQNKENIRSVSIKMEGITHSVEEIIDCFELADLRNVDKIYYKGTFDDCDITPLLHSSVKSLSLISRTWQDYDFIAVESTWSDLVSSRLYSLDNLEAIRINSFEMSHDQLEQLVKHVSTRNSIREIELWGLRCSEHWKSCTGCRLDLSARSQLKSLSLVNIPLSELNIDKKSLEKCDVGHLPTSGLTSRLLSYLPSASKLHTFSCSVLESSEDIDKMAATLRQLGSVKHVWLWRINLGGRALPITSYMRNIEQVVLDEITMQASVFTELVDVVQKPPQTVTVTMWDCKITTEEEFQREKLGKIKTSPFFIVGFDGITQSKQYALVFKTVKGQDLI